MGYTTGLLYIRHTTGMTPPGVSEQYRGSDSTAVTEAAMKFPKSYAEMLNITHTHLLGMLVDLRVERRWPSRSASARRALAAGC